MTLLNRPLPVCFSFMIAFAACWEAGAQDNISAHAVKLRASQLDLQSRYRETRAACEQQFASLKAYMGTVDEPLAARNTACQFFIGQDGAPVAGYRQCSDKFFEQYETARRRFRECFDQERTLGERRLSAYREWREIDKNARAAARAAGDAPDAPTDDPGWIGLRFINMSAQTMAQTGVEDGLGVYVEGTRALSPARKAGLKEGDVVRALNGVTIETDDDLRRAGRDFRSGEVIVLDVIRGGELLAIYVAVEPR